MRQKVRRIVIYLALLAFPVTLNYFSPYVSVTGAFMGIIAGSVLMFALQFISGIFFGRVWCSWLCPMAGLSEIGMTVNSRNVAARRLKVVRYSIFGVWFAVLLAGFVLAGGIRGIDPLLMTENVISVDEPMKYGIYYSVLLIFFVLTIWIGKRGACHSVCWMAPFLVAGTKLGRLLHVPQLRIAADAGRCIDCKKCDQKCPMSIAVNSEVKKGIISSTDCILCGECIDGCPKKVLHFKRRTKYGERSVGS